MNGCSLWASATDSRSLRRMAASANQGSSPQISTPSSRTTPTPTSRGGGGGVGGWPGGGGG